MSNGKKTQTVLAKNIEQSEILENSVKSIIKKNKYVPGITVIGDKLHDQSIIEEYGSMELYLMHKIKLQWEEVAFYKKQNIELKKELRAANITIRCHKKSSEL